MTETDAKVPPKTKEQLQADVAAIRARLSGNVESLIGQVHPKSIANRAVNDARDLLDAEATSARRKLDEAVSTVRGFVGPKVDDAADFVKDEHGWRTDRLMLLGGVLAGLVTLVLPIVAASIAIGRAVRAHKKSAR
ncbi:DUF3618 domain-containing protein [Propionicicella superfundia]|uniref:DUF3618 domain-containing protein n=1 Tax=Propionicicella superfundia TaxID=348582 RepID=UPI0004000D1E|nr:DUF3618 domain-containing protein [Propionicicella superfundia]